MPSVRAEPQEAPGSSIYHRLRGLNQRLVSAYRRGWGPQQLILLLTTTGRKSGLARTTPLQYEIVGGNYYVASARGLAADWIRNIVAEPRVTVETAGEQFAANAEVVTDPLAIADFLEVRRRRRPVMIRAIMMAEGVSPWAGRAELERFAAGKALAVLRPAKAGGETATVR